jgi:hypothetical protein
MARELVCWVTPFTNLRSLPDAVGVARQMAQSVSTEKYPWTARLLVPSHYGVYPQSQCKQNLPPDMRVSSPDDVMPMRHYVNGKGLRFGVWGVPLDNTSPETAAAYAAAAGFYSANFEPTAAFWAPGDDPAAIDEWWGRFWNALPDQQALNGRVSATVVPNGWGLGAFRNSLPNLAAGCNALALEVYGGPNTAGEYVYPSLWPTESFALMPSVGVPCVPILARANLHAQIGLASGLGRSQVHVWAI